MVRERVGRRLLYIVYEVVNSTHWNSREIEKLQYKSVFGKMLDWNFTVRDELQFYSNTFV